MLYLSELIGKRVADRQGNSVARIRDLVAELVATDQEAPTEAFLDEEGQPVERDVPVIKGVLARTGRRRQPFFIPIDQVQSLGRDGARIRSSKLDVEPFERREGEERLVGNGVDVAETEEGRRTAVYDDRGGGRHGLR